MNSGSEIGIQTWIVPSLVTIVVIWVKMTPWKKRAALMLRWQRASLRALCTLPGPPPASGTGAYTL